MHELPLLSRLESIHLILFPKYSNHRVDCVDLSSLLGVRKLIVTTNDFPSCCTATSRDVCQVLLGRMPFIAHLELHYCSFDSSVLGTFTSLQTLVFVSCTPYSHDPGVRLTDIHLAPLTRLERLSLCDACRVTGVALLGMPNLTHVSLRRCVNVTDAVVRALWTAMALKPTHCELVLDGCVLLTSACVPVEYEEPSPGDLAAALGRMREVGGAVFQAMIFTHHSLGDADVFSHLPMIPEVCVAAAKHVKLGAIVNNLVVSGKTGNVVVDVSIDH